MKKLIACVLSLSIASTLCTSSVCAAGVDKVEKDSNGSTIIYVSSENVENYKAQLLKDIEKYKKIEKKVDGISNKLPEIVPYFTLGAWASSMLWYTFNLFFEKKDLDIPAIEAQDFSDMSTENDDFSDSISDEAKMGMIKSLAEKFKRKYHFTGGKISSSKEKRIVAICFLLTIPNVLLTYLIGAIVPGNIWAHYSRKVLHLEHIKDQLNDCFSPEDCPRDEMRKCGIEIELNEKLKSMPIMVFPQENCEEGGNKND